MPEGYDEGPEWKPPYYPIKTPEDTEHTWKTKLLEYMIKRFRPLRKHWHNTGVATIATATAARTYEDVINFITDLGYPAIAGVVQNRGPGSLFFVVSVQPDEQSGTEIRLDPGETFRWGGLDNPHQIYYLHIRADADNTAYQVIGGSGKLEFTGAGESSTKDFVRSDKDDHFTGGLAQYATEAENLTGLKSDKVRITGVTVWSDQNLNYRFYFYQDDDGAETDADLDAMIDYFEINASDWVRLGNANLYRFALSDLSINYEDKDASKELHPILENLDTTAKNAGATGEIVIEVKYEF